MLKSIDALVDEALRVDPVGEEVTVVVRLHDRNRSELPREREVELAASLQPRTPLEGIRLLNLQREVRALRPVWLDLPPKDPGRVAFVVVTHASAVAQADQDVPGRRPVNVIAWALWTSRSSGEVVADDLGLCGIRTRRAKVHHDLPVLEVPRCDLACLLQVRASAIRLEVRPRNGAWEARQQEVGPR